MLAKSFWLKRKKCRPNIQNFVDRNSYKTTGLRISTARYSSFCYFLNDNFVKRLVSSRAATVLQQRNGGVLLVCFFESATIPVIENIKKNVQYRNSADCCSNNNCGW